jgi:5-deoxy-D-glucuronate isomerase
MPDTSAARPFALIVAGEGVVSVHGSYTAASTALDRRSGGFNRYMRKHLTIRDDRAKYAAPLTEHTCAVCRAPLTEEQVRRYTCCNDREDFHHCGIGHENVTQARLLARCYRD